MSEKKRFVQVGVGGRSEMYWKSICEDYKDQCEIVAICDNNEGRMNLRKKNLEKLGVDVKLYADSDFEKMIAECKPDTVIVTTKDCTHDDYICRALELGCDVITEKPMTTDEKKCERIVEAQKKSGKTVTVTFNYRYAPPRTQLKDMLMSGVIGNIVSVDFHWLLNTSHGADYFRRWHRWKKNSGGLMVHKSTHHFDLVNWWLSDIPESVFAVGKRNYYRPETAKSLGLENAGNRCHGCADSGKCPFALKMAENEGLKELYLDNEEFDGYQRDKCVFSDDMDIEDTMNVIVNYRSGATMSYSLHAFSPWEGFIVTFNGTKGRIEHTCQESVYVNGDGNIPGELVPEGTKTKVYPHFLPGYEVELWKGTGGHGGGDPVLLADLFDKNAPEDKYMRAADYRSGAFSIITGIAANKSFVSGEMVKISDILCPVPDPDYPVMPKPFEPVASDYLAKIEEFRNKNKK